jgi:hypothetical protein
MCGKVCPRVLIARCAHNADNPHPDSPRVSFESAGFAQLGSHRTSASLTAIEPSRPAGKLAPLVTDPIPTLEESLLYISPAMYQFSEREAEPVVAAVIERARAKHPDWDTDRLAMEWITYGMQLMPHGWLSLDNYLGAVYWAARYVNFLRGFRAIVTDPPVTGLVQ